MFSLGFLRRAAALAAVSFGLQLATTSPASEPTDPERLTRNVIPLAQAASLTLDPNLDDFAGSTRIDLRITTASSSFRLHALGPVISSATLRDLAGRSVPLAVAITNPNLGLVTLTAPNTLPPGGYVLELAFTGNYARNSLCLYKTVRSSRFYRSSPTDVPRTPPQE